MPRLVIYCDTCTLPPNIRNKPTELEALKTLRLLRMAGKCDLLRSHIVWEEIINTPDAEQRQRLEEDFKLVDAILHDEKLIGINSAFDPYGGFVNTPMLSDTQNDNLCDEIYCKLKVGPSACDPQTRRDAQHITQAICNRCDVFLTCDYRTIIKPARVWLEERFKPMKIRSPTEMIAEIAASPRTSCPP
jgi:hypothetical protein